MITSNTPPDIEMLSNRRRLKMIRISLEALPVILFSYAHITKLPSGIVVRSIEKDFRRLTLNIIVSHPSFDIVDEACEIPNITNEDFCQLTELKEEVLKASMSNGITTPEELVNTIDNQI